ncbi:MAG: DUF4058 family protein [Fimbriiglobus sp.]
MPLRDHFRPPVVKKSSWEGFHAMWPASIVRQLRSVLPAGYVAEPRVHLGTAMEIDIGAIETHDSESSEPSRTSAIHSSDGSALWTAPSPMMVVETDPPEEYEYEVRIYDIDRDRELVAAIEIVSPANKDRPESREAFVAKCAALLKAGVAVSIVDLVTVRRFNLYAQLMTFIRHPDSSMSLDSPAIYVASVHWPTLGSRARLTAWSRELVIGQSLPELPLWLRHDLAIPVNLEDGYEQACHDLWID